MANFKLEFYDFFNVQLAQIKADEIDDTNVINIQFKDINGKFLHPYIMDKSTAIKFAKTLRTEINKITAREEGKDGQY